MFEFDFSGDKVDKREKGYTCPCCQQFVKLYKRKINSNMCTALITLFKKKVNGFVHLENFMRENGFKRCGDASYLVHWGFLERLSAKREDNSSRNGYYKITGRGLMFVEGTITAKEKILIFNNKFEGFDGKDVTIKDALGTKFNYETLMNDN